MEASLIFVVDDSTDSGEMASALLRSMGWHTRTFSDAGHCLRAALQHAPACILSDLNMPVMNGLQLMDALAAAGLTIPVVIMTGSPADSAPVRRAAMRAAGIIRKPYEAEALDSLLHSAVAGDAAKAA